MPHYGKLYTVMYRYGVEFEISKLILPLVVGSVPFFKSIKNIKNYKIVMLSLYQITRTMHLFPHRRAWLNGVNICKEGRNNFSYCGGLPNNLR